MVTSYTNADLDSLRCLFFHGPTWDGDVPSKQSRDGLIRMKLADRYEGWTFLTRAGIEHCIGLGLDREKGPWERRRREAMAAPKPPKVVLIMGSSGNGSGDQA